jgi:small subunit ribosomal protein S1
LEAYAPLKHIKKEDNSTAIMLMKPYFKVIEFNRDDKRIIVSHARYLEDIKKEADDIGRRLKKRKKKKKSKKPLKNSI